LAAGHIVVAFDVDDAVENIEGATAVVADVCQPEDVARVVGIAAGLGDLRVLVNNAGNWRRTPLRSDWTQVLEDWDYIMDTNLKGVLLLSRAAVPLMRQAGGGHIVNVSSTMVLPVREDASNDPETDLYNASQWALNGFTDSWTRSLKAHGIKVNGLCLSSVNTPMLKQQRPDEPLSTDVLQPEEVAGLLVELIESDRSGENIGVWMGEPVRIGERPPAHRRITG
jgi:NAD(P)-dependent dehydrogenase (short-subunit alcohol dehydrogenase family)